MKEWKHLIYSVSLHTHTKLISVYSTCKLIPTPFRDISQIHNERNNKDKNKMPWNRKENSAKSRNDTRKLPWLTCVKVNIHESPFWNIFMCNLFVKIMAHQFFITRIKPEPGGSAAPMSLKPILLQCLISSWRN